jgi:formylmethanofuran dehydrogenase subunit E
MDHQCERCAEQGRRTSAALIADGRPLCGECWEETAGEDGEQ